jgi:hypothetical protein
MDRKQSGAYRIPEYREVARKRRKWVQRGLAYGVSAGLHLGIFAVLLSSRIDGPPVEQMRLDPVEVFMTPAPEPPGAASAPKKAQPTPPKPKTVTKTPPQKIIARITPTPVKSRVEPIAASEAPAQPAEHAALSDGELAGAATAGSGRGGGEACDMAEIIQTALRNDAKVQAAVARVNSGKAIHVWNGHWVQSPGEEGLGLAGVRETIMVKVGFAPAACRNQAMRGLVLLSLNDSGTARVVIGGGAWKWSDLLGLRG